MGKRKSKKAEAEGKPKKKRRRGQEAPVPAVIGGAGALVLSEDVRNKALDALFGSEEEFKYSPPDAPRAMAPAASLG